MTPTVRDTPAASRYEIYDGHQLAGFSAYKLTGHKIAFLHTEIDPAFARQGLAKQLVTEELDDARRRGLAVLPFCPYIRKFIARNPTYLDLVPDTHRDRFDLPKPAAVADDGDSGALVDAARDGGVVAGAQDRRARIGNVFDVELLVVAGCPHEGLMAVLLREALDDAGFPHVPVRRTVVTDAGDAERRGFAGSPTILIDGQDPFPQTVTRTAFGRQVYGPGSSRESVPRAADLRAALTRVAETKRAVVHSFTTGG